MRRSALPGDEPGQLAGARTFSCSGCGFPITLLEGDDQPACPRCGGVRFEQSSIFSDHTAGLAAPAQTGEPSWLPGLRATLAGKGPHIAWEEGDGIEVVPVREGFLRVGRSFRADIRLADATVSRRHALIHNDGSTTTVLDDRSLNGVFVDGERVDWRPLEDGSEVGVGSFRLHFIAVDAQHDSA